MALSSIAVAALLSGIVGCGSSAQSTSSNSQKSTDNSTQQAKSSQPAPASVDDLSKFTNLKADGTKVNSKLTIGFAQTDVNTPWRTSEMDNFKTWADKLGVKLVWNQANGDASKELSNVQNLLSQKPDVLIVDPVATAPLTPVINMANSAHIPLIVVDRALSQKPGTGEYQLFIGADQFKIGKQSADKWIEKLKKEQKTDSPKGNVAIIMGGVGQEPAIERNKGVEAAIKPYPNIKLVATESGDWTLEGGRKVMEAYIQRFPKGSLQGVFCASDEMMLGAMEALKAANRTDINGWFFTGDGQLQGLQAIVDGTNVADTQNPPFYGQASIEAAIAISQGVKFNGATINLNNETFTNVTPDGVQKTKDYIKKIQASKSLF